MDFAIGERKRILRDGDDRLVFAQQQPVPDSLAVWHVLVSVEAVAMRLLVAHVVEGVVAQAEIYNRSVWDMGDLDQLTTTTPVYGRPVPDVFDNLIVGEIAYHLKLCRMHQLCHPNTLLRVDCVLVRHGLGLLATRLRVPGTMGRTRSQG